MNALSHDLFIETANHFGTPFYLYDLEKIKKQYDSIQNNVPLSCEIFYSIKANPTIGICQYFCALGANCEVSSEFELLTAIKSGFAPSKIIFVGPVKTINALTLSIQFNIRAIICESSDEIKLINQIAKTQCKKMHIMLRINPDFVVINAPLKMSGVASQFGIDLTEFNNVFNEANLLDSVKIAGIQIYNATRILDVKSIIDNVKQILTLAETLAETLLFEWNYIDIGGGLGVPYFEGESNLDSALLLDKLNKLFLEYQKKHTSTQFMIELGRYFVAESGYLISEIQSVKTSHKKKFAILDAGIHCHLASSGLGSFIHRNFPYQFIRVHAEQSDYHDLHTYHVVGPLCTPGDVVLKDIQSSLLQKGDLLVLRYVGAYGLTASPSRFLSHGAPAEIAMHNQKFYLMRKRETIDTLWNGQNDLSSIFTTQQETIYV